MEDLYAQMGNYLVTCIDDKETLTVMLAELMPLLKQVNYSQLRADDLKEVTDKIGLGDQAITILSNIVVIYRVNGGLVNELLSKAGLKPATIKEVESDPNYVWIIAGILLLGSGIIANLRDSLYDSTKRSDTDRT